MNIVSNKCSTSEIIYCNKKRKLPQSSGCNHFENMTENVHVCFEVHIEKN